MPKDFNQSTSLESYLKLHWVDSNTSTIIIRTLYVSNINTDCVQLFDSLFHTPPQANYNNCNSVCSPCSIIHLLRQVKLIGKSGELHFSWSQRFFSRRKIKKNLWDQGKLHWEDYQLKTTLLLLDGTLSVLDWIVFMIDSDPQHERKL